MKHILEEYKDCLGKNDYEFLLRVYEDGLEKYCTRIRAVGFENLNHILDAGCGFGQWSVAMTRMNKHVTGMDISSIRLLIAERIAKESNRSNATFKYGELQALPFNDHSFDGVFCYGSIFISDPRKALREFYRVLVPGGKLYVNANGLGWSLNLWLNSPNKTDDYDPRINVAKAFRNTVNYYSGLGKEDGQLILEKEELIKLIEENNFKNLICGDEGTINVNKDKALSPIPFFKGNYHGFTGVYEILANK